MKMRRILSVLLAVCLLLGMTATLAFATDDPPVEISTAADLLLIADDPDGDYILTNDITITEADVSPGGVLYDETFGGFKPIGLSLVTKDDSPDPEIPFPENYYDPVPFTGTLNGQGYCIKGLTINVVSDTNVAACRYLGLFAQNSGTVRDLHIVDAAYTLTAPSVAASVIYTFFAGGIAARNATDALIEKCSFGGTIDVTVPNLKVLAAGIAGDNNGTIKNCLNTAEVTARHTIEAGFLNYLLVAGIAGENSANGLIQTSFNRGKLTASAVNESVGLVGAVIGWNYGRAENSFSAPGLFFPSDACDTSAVRRTGGQHTESNVRILTDAELGDAETYTDFDPAIWKFEDNGPSFITHEHVWAAEATLVRPATCTGTGLSAICCTECGATKPGSEEILEALGHDAGSEYVVDKEPTCTEAGSKSYHCNRCKASIESTAVSIDPVGHTWNTEYTVDRAATASKEGVKSIHCSVCGAIKPGSEVVIPKLAPAVTFKDVPKKAWYYDAVAYTVSKGIFAGITQTTFEPNTPMTRAMFVATLSRMAGVKVNNNVKTVFSDVKSGQWYTGAVKWASDNGIVSGSDGKFMPNDPITREQICTILVTYAKYKKITLTPKQAAVSFKDAAKISKWAKAAVTTCQRAGLVAGANGSFNPKGKATRAEVAQILTMFDKNFGK